MDIIHKIGRRKKAIARVYISKGKGKLTVNERDFKAYFTTSTLQYKVTQPLNLTDNQSNFDIKIIIDINKLTSWVKRMFCITPRQVDKKFKFSLETLNFLWRFKSFRPLKISIFPFQTSQHGTPTF